MADIFTQMVDDIYTSPVARAATYTPEGGVAAAVRVLRIELDPLVDSGTFSHVGKGAILAVRISDVAAPAIGDAVAVGGLSYKVQAKPRFRNERALEWRLDCAAA